MPSLFMSPRDVVVVHDYLGVDEDIVWQVVTEDLPKLVSALEPIVPPAHDL